VWFDVMALLVAPYIVPVLSLPERAREMRGRLRLSRA